jgi:hypothetical protein
MEVIHMNLDELETKPPTETKPKPKSRAKPKVVEKNSKFGYLQNKEGRVFIATPPLMKQMTKGKFGLIRITKSVYDEAIENGGLAEPLPDFEDDDEG